MDPEITELQELYDPQELAARQAYYREVIRNYTMMSDTFARNMLKDRTCAEYVIQVITGHRDLKIQEVTVQADYKNLQGRSSILDCVARDAENSLYDIEVEQSDSGASPKRARYYSGLLDMNVLKESEDYTLLRKSYVIFIAEHDVLGDGQPLYLIERTIRGSGKRFPDDSHIIYVNAGLQEDTDLGHLVHDFHCSDPADMYSEILRARASTLKNTSMEVDSMCDELKKIEQYGMEKGMEKGLEKGLEKGMEKGLEKGMEKGRTITQRQSAFRMQARGFDIETIADLLDVPGEQVKIWLAEEPVSA